MPGVNTCGKETVLDEELLIVMAAPLTLERFDRSTVNGWLAFWTTVVLLNSCAKASVDILRMKTARLSRFITGCSISFDCFGVQQSENATGVPTGRTKHRRNCNRKSLKSKVVSSLGYRSTLR